jgi:hypothetical protein
MFNDIATSRKIWQALGVVSAIAISLATASAALAGECPAEKMKPNAHQMVDYKPVGVTDVTLGSKAAGPHRRSRIALPQTDHRSRWHRALAQP